MQTLRFIPKILFGLLVAGVWVFGMQSSIDALTFGTSRSGDLQTSLPNEDFEITFSVSLRSSASIENDEGERVDEDNDKNLIDSSGYYVNADGDYVEKAGGSKVVDSDKRVKASDAKRYHYNEEAVKINIKGAMIKKVGRHDIVATGNHTLTETGEDGAELSSRITLTLSAPTAKTVEITISDETPENDKPEGTISVPPSHFTVYVVEQQSKVVGQTTTLDSGKDGVEYAYDTEDPLINTYFKFVAGSNAPVYYSVEGSGSVYVGKSSTRRTSTTKTLWTSSVAPVFLETDGGTSKVTAWISGNAGQTAIFIFSGPTPDTYPLIERTQGNNQTGAVGGRLEDFLEVKVTDGNRRAVPGVAVSFTSKDKGTFIPVPGTTVYDPTPKEAKEVDLVDDTVNTTIATSNRPVPIAEMPMWVQTDSNGLARVYYQLGKDTRTYAVTAALQGDPLKISKTFDATAVAVGRSASLVLVSGDDQRSEADTHDVTDPLVVRVRRPGGYRIPDVTVRFTALTGVLEPAPGRSVVKGPGQSEITTSGQEIFIETDAHGEAAVTYNAGQIAGAKTVTARVDDEEKATQYDFQIRQVEFNIDGSAPAPDPVVRPVLPVQPVLPTIQPPSLSADISGAPGSTQTLSVNTEAVAEVSVGFSTDSFLTAGGRVLQRSFTGSRDVSIVLPNRVGIYTLTVTASTAAGGTSRDQRSIRVVEADNGGAGTLSVVLVGAQANGHQTLQVNAQTTAGAAVSGTLTVTLTGAGVSTTVATTNGSVRTIIALPATAGILTASATGYTSGLVTLPARTTTTTTLPPVSEPSRITIGGAATRSGTVNEELEAPLLVRVLDDAGDGVEDARVIFRVTAGQGRLSERGNGRAIGVQTDSNGYARADFTPLSAGSITVEAEVRGVNTPVTFTVTTGSTPPTTGTTSTGGTPSTDISPVVHVGAASRPPMLWVEGGAIYALVGANIQKFAPSVDNALNITVAGGKVYWTEKTGESGGTINSANLDGTGVRELVSIRSVPMGIAVDTARSKLYWTASSGKIKQANLDGSGRENVVPGGLDTPMDLALAGGNVYWTEANGSVRFVNLTGQKNVRDISTGLDTPGSLAVGGGKVYWTEKTAESAGTINRANLDGTDVRELTSIRSVPIGIAVDTARSKLYWTASSGKIKQANLNGSGAKNVVSGLGSPGEIVLSNSIAAPTTPTTPTPPTTASKSKYDVNSDGSVDNMDAGLVAEAMGTSTAKYDVNGDGTVNFLDLLLVFDNRDAGAAAAPTIVGLKLNAVQIERIQEQIDLLIATNDRSPAAMRTLVYLQQLLATARPEKTRLLANYPNPFNPETWMPYELATDTPVKITIYTPQGVVIRTLQLGHQSAGYYVGRDRAAYWDGRNALGEQVASGLYFYQLETDEMSSMRKMVILK